MDPLVRTGPPAWARSARTRLIGGAAALLAALLAVPALLAPRPRSDREWARDQARSPTLEIDADRWVKLEGVRDFRYGSAGPAEEAWREVSFDAADVRRVWFALAPFASRWRGLAHTFVSFELAGDRFLAVSVEARREAHERYSILGGLTRRFETVYVVGTEEDLIGVRALRGDTLYLYPSRATPEQARTMLVDMLSRAHALGARPEFYNTFTNNCATNLRDHVNRVLADPLPFGWGVLFPGWSDELALERGLLDTELPLERARERFRVDERAREALADGEGSFSRRIRGGG